jgi:hypothetical protein
MAYEITTYRSENLAGIPAPTSDIVKLVPDNERTFLTATAQHLPY